MDTSRFDHLARQFAEPGTRRNAIRLGLISGLGIGVAKLGADQALAGKHKHKHKNKKKKKTVSETCKKSDQCGGGLSCKAANSQNSCFGSTEKRCCKPVGAPCNDGCECCGTDVICNGGYCDQS